MKNETRESSERVQKFAWWLDSSIPLPLGFRIGLEPIIGLIPGIGDTLGGIMSSYIIAESVRAGLPFSIIFRMVLNVFFDMLVGAVPVLGDVLDFGIKANRKNAKIFESFIESPRKTRARSRFVIFLVVAGFLTLVLAFAALIYFALYGLWQLVRAL